MNIKTWYGTSVRIPTLGSYQFTTFAASCLGLVRSVLRRKLEKDVFVSFRNVETAVVDSEKGRIYISEKFLKGEFKKDIVSSAEQTLTYLLGVIVHETGHIAYSPQDLEPFVNYIRDNTESVFHEKVAFAVSNILEDIYIEFQIHQDVPVVSWMLDSLNDYMMNEEDYEEIVSESLHIEQPPAELRDVAHLLNTILMAKVYESINSNPYITDLFAKAKKAKELGGLEERLRHYLQVYDSIMSNMEEGEGFSFQDNLDRIIGVTAKKEEVREANSSKSNDLNKILSTLKDALIEITGDEHEESYIKIERSMPMTSYPIDIDRKYFDLAQFARQRTAVNRPYGLNRKRGHDIRNLYRIATDQKIFAETVEMNHFKPMQVIILVDCSGSMCADSGGKTRLQRAMEAAAGATYGLMEGHCEVAVYGHSADILTSGDVHIYKFKEFCEPVSALLHRFPDDDSLCRENRDGNALKAVAEKFRGRKRKLLIVISDGIPQAAAYYGPKANQHCWRMVNEIRKKGITVLSISITSSAARGNDFIYGAENNVFNEDPNCIEQIVRKLLE